jgi:hypothetical protein
MNPVVLLENNQPVVVTDSEQQAILVMVNRRKPFSVQYLYDEGLFLRMWSMLPHRMDHEPYWDAQYKLIAQTKPVAIRTKRCCGRKLPRYIQVGSNFMIYCEICGWHVSTFTGSKAEITKRWESSLTPMDHYVTSHWRDAMMMFRHINEYAEAITQKAIETNSRITG